VVTDLASRLPDTDVYVMDHRGTGHSHRLGCAVQDVPGSGGGYALAPADVPACLAELRTKGDYDRLPYFTTTQAAHDVAAAIQATRTPSQKVYVWGGSYGTHWAHRLLQVAPSATDGIVFDGYLTPEHFAFVDYDKGVDEVGRLFAASCTADASCSRHMGGDALEKAKAIFAALAAHPCGTVDYATARVYSAVFLDGWFTRAWLFPFFHRLERCSMDDQAILKTFLANVDVALGGTSSASSSDGGASNADTYTGSGILQYNIVLSELWNRPGAAEPTPEELAAAADAQVFLAGQSYPASIEPLRASWPLPPDDYSTLPTPVIATNTSLLWLAGGLDTRTPPSETSLIGQYYAATDLVLPGASHTPALNSPLASNPTRNCGEAILEGFVEHGTVDAGCTSGLLSPLYDSPDPTFAKTWWGTSDDWGDGDAAPPTPRVRLPETGRMKLDVSAPNRLALHTLHRSPR
jgi:pimeloyl-ACP methyl ester carboxylesterase